jgi:hypothetical protein
LNPVLKNVTGEELGLLEIVDDRETELGLLENVDDMEAFHSIHDTKAAVLRPTSDEAELSIELDSV